jgi:FkbM family methyltransferase
MGQENKLAFMALSTEAALLRTQRRNTSITTVIDVGASDGRWSLDAMKYYPHASYYLIEAQQQHEKALMALRQRKKNLQYVIAAAGARLGEIYFDAEDLFGGVASENPVNEKSLRIPVITIDSIVQKHNLKGPFLLKLDTHGYEVPIFEGASETLCSSSLIIVETYNFKLTSDSLRFHEICFYLEKKGFRCIDISEPMFRSRDQAFWQIDLFFIPIDSSEFEYNNYG